MSETDPVEWPDLAAARAAFDSGDGAGVKVAIIDSGVDVSHPELNGVILEDNLAISSDSSSIRIEENADGDVYGHGTAVAGLLLKEAPRVTIGSFRALNSSNNARSFVIAECVNQAISRGYHIINCSFGCRGLPRYVMDYKDWVDRAYLSGVQIVAASSNINPGIREWPAHFASVISVRGIDCEPEKLFQRSDKMVSFLARGDRVEVPWIGGGMKTETGSSYAAPFVAGKIARLLSSFPSMQPSLVKPLLEVLATPYKETL